MRVGLSIVGFISAFFMPWWITVIIMIGLSVRYRAWEVLIMGFIMDALWTPASLMHVPLYTVIAIVIVWLFEPLRDQLLE